MIIFNTKEIKDTFLVKKTKFLFTRIFLSLLRLFVFNIQIKIVQI